MSLNSHLQELIGRTITDVVAMEGPGRPTRKIHRVLDDGGYFEFYGQDINNMKGCWPGGIDESRHTERAYEVVSDFGEG